MMFLYYLTESTDTEALSWFDAQHKLQWPNNQVHAVLSPIDNTMVITAQHWDQAALEQQPWYSAAKVIDEAARNALFAQWFPPLIEEE